MDLDYEPEELFLLDTKIQRYIPTAINFQVVLEDMPNVKPQQTPPLTCQSHKNTNDHNKIRTRQNRVHENTQKIKVL